MGHISESGIIFLKRIANYPKHESWEFEYDENYDLKYSFYFGGTENYNIITPLTLFEYARRVVTFTPKAFEELFAAPEKLPLTPSEPGKV